MLSFTYGILLERNERRRKKRVGRCLPRMVVSSDETIARFAKQVLGLSSDSALERIQTLQRDDARSQKIFNRVLDLFEERHGVSAAEKAWELLLERAEIQPTRQSFNAMLRMYSKTKEITKILELKERMENDGISLDVVSYTMIISMYGDKGNVEMAEKTMVEMEANGVKPNTVTYNALLKCLSKENCFDKIRFWRTRMRQQKVPDSDMTRGIIVQSHIRSGQINEAERLIDRMIRKRQKVGIELLTSLMNGYANAKDIEGVRRSRQLFKEAGVELGIYAFNVMLKAFWQAGDADGMMETSRIMRAMRVRPTVATFTTLMKAYSARGDMIRVQRCFRQMSIAGIKPDLVAYNTLLNSFRATGDLGSALHYVEQMKRRGLKPDIVTYNTIMQLYSERGELTEVKATMQKMTEESLKPSECSFNILISACGNAGDLDAAEDAFQQLLKTKMKPTVITLTALISAHARNGDCYVAKRILKQMVEIYKVKPNRITYASIVHSMVRQGLYEEAYELRSEAESLGFEVSMDLKTINSALEETEGDHW